MSAKYQLLAEKLRTEVQQLANKGGGKLDTEQEMSRRYQMSRQTVRHALNILEGEGLIERRQGSGSYVRGKEGGSIRQIAVITTFIDDYIFPTILHDAQSSFSRAGYSTLVFATENSVSKEREILSMLLDHSVSAVLVEGSKTALPTPNSDLYLSFRNKGIPVLFLHGIYSNISGFPCLYDDNFNGGYQLASYLLSKGHRDIAGIFKSDDAQGPQRYHGLVSALRDAGLPIKDENFFWYDTENRKYFLDTEDRSFLEQFINRRLSAVSAVVCYNDEVAYLLIKQLIQSGKQVPGDVAVVSFDNSFYSQIGPVPITSLGHKSNRTGKTAAAMLLDMLSGAEVSSRRMEWELISRSSG